MNMISKKAKQFIETLHDSSANSATIAVEYAEEEVKEKCCIAFRNLLLRAALALSAGEQHDWEEEFKKTMSNIK